MTSTSTLRPASLDELCAMVREHERVALRGGGTKTALSAARQDAFLLDMRGLTGLLEYEPGEFTFTALAGTPVTDVARALAEHGQYLPFDPPLAQRGATLGGTVGSGLNGPGRYRFGGVRDFILGVRYVDPDGRMIRAGGKVVKNAAGFDISKLMVGSLGALGVLAELSFKVFPRLPATATVSLSCATLTSALDALYRLTAAPVDLDAVELVANAGNWELLVRLAGLPEALPDRLNRVRALLGGGEPVAEADEPGLWDDMREFAWVPEEWVLVKIPLTPRRIGALEDDFRSLPHFGSLLRRYGAGGQVAWAALPPVDIAALDGTLMELGLPGLVVLGQADRPRIGRREGEEFARRVKLAMDPAGRFGEA